MRKICALVSSACLLWPLAGAVETQPTGDPSSLPLAARVRISTSVGRDSSEYRVHAVRDGFRGTIATQKLATRFTRHGVEVRSGRARWRLLFQGHGYGKAVRLEPVVSPRAKLNRVEYQRGPLTEWYVHGPAGLEQGFTIDRPPGKRNGQPLTLQLAISGNLMVKPQPDGIGLQLSDRSGQTRWLYAGLRAHDVAGRDLPAWLELHDQRLSLYVNDTGAVYPLVVDPIVQLAELTAANGTADAFWGYSVAMTGNMVVVGSPNATVGSNLDQGAVYVFVKPASGWTNMTQTALLTASDGAAGDGLGSSVSSNGNMIVAGAPQAAIGKNLAQGAAYVFVQPGSGWVNMNQNAKLTASDGVEFSGLGAAAAVAENTITARTTIAVGAPYQLGAVYVFIEPAAGWSGTLTQSAELTGSGPDVAGLGNSVALTGNTIAAGAQRSTVNSNFQQGAVYVFVQPSGGWVDGTQTAELTASDGKTFDQLGYAVAMGNNTIIAGAPNATVGSNVDQGAGYVFVEPGAGWANMTETAKLTSSDGQTGDSFGSSVAALNGNLMVLGAPGATINSNASQGAVYVFLKPASGWQTTSNFYFKLTDATGVAGEEFGTGVAVNGNFGVMTAPGSTVGSNSSQGAAYLFGNQ